MTISEHKASGKLEGEYSFTLAGFCGSKDGVKQLHAVLQIVEDDVCFLFFDVIKDGETRRFGTLTAAVRHYDNA